MTEKIEVTELLIKGIPKELKTKFDGYTRLAGSDMSKEIRRFMAEYVAKTENE